MSAEALLGLSVFAVATLFTPGPNNVMLMASGVNFGFARTLPHILGVTLGFALMIGLVAIGLGGVIAARPEIHGGMRVVAALYMLWLAWKIAGSGGGAEPGSAGARPLGFIGAAAFQWVNPKAWVIGVSAMALYTIPERPFLSVWLISLVFAAVCLPSIAIWAGFGVSLRGFLSDPARLKWFNIAMGLLLVASLWPMLRH